MINQLFLRFLLLPAAIAAGLSGIAAAQEQELLEPEQAFSFRAEMTDDGLIEAVWTIADDYYMYRDKFRFELTGGDATLGEAEFPPAKKKADPVFGDTEVYLQRVEILIPVAGAGGSAFKLTAHGQGCNEPVGVCYAPIKYETPLALPVGGVNPASADEPQVVDAGKPLASLDTVADLRNLLSDLGEEPQFLDVDEAFKLELVEQAPDRLRARFLIADGYYLYRDKIALTAEGAGRIQGLSLPEGEIKEDEYFGKMQVFKQDFSFSVPLRRTTQEPGTLTVNATYQGCADGGICYPPVKKQFNLQLPALIAAASAEPSSPPTREAPSSPVPAEDNLEGDKTFWALLLGAFGAGILLSYLQCSKSREQCS